MKTLMLRKNKYNATKTKVDDITFDSKAEAKRYDELKLLKRCGEISYFIRQPKFDLPGGTSYRADFLVVWEDGHISIEDVKGFKTASFIKAKKQVEALYPIEIDIIQYGRK